MVEPAGDPTLASSSRRRWFRFSLRRLLIATTLFSLAFGYYINRVQNEQRAAKAIVDANGTIVYDWQIQRCTVLPSGPPEPPGPEWLRKLLGPHWFDHIVEVRLNRYFIDNSESRFAVMGPHLLSLPKLRSLTLWGGKLDGNDYRLLGRMTQLEKLFLSQEAEIRPQDAAALAHASGLREIHLDNAKISPEALHKLSKLPQLEKLDIDCTPYDRMGEPLAEYPLDDNAARAISTFPKLHALSLFATKITDKGMTDLCRLSRLESLVVSSPHITSTSFAAISNLQSLKTLGTWQWKIDDRHFAILSQQHHLTSLELVTHLTDESVRHVAALGQLEELTLYGDKITSASIPHLHRLTKLIWLDVSDTSIDRDELASQALQQAFPNCTDVLPQTKSKYEIRRVLGR